MNHLKKRGKSILNSSYFRWGLVLIYMGAIFYFSSLSYIPKPEAVLGLTISASLKHFSVYLILGLLLIYALKDNKKKVLLTMIIGILYAISDEIHQSFVPGRTMDIMDVLMDALGILFGVLIIKWKLRKK